MKAKSKSQLADAAGVSVDTLMEWCKPHMEVLTAMGLTPGMRVLPPRIVKYIADQFCIDVED